MTCALRSCDTLLSNRLARTGTQRRPAEDDTLAFMRLPVPSVLKAGVLALRHSQAYATEQACLSYSLVSQLRVSHARAHVVSIS